MLSARWSRPVSRHQVYSALYAAGSPALVAAPKAEREHEHEPVAQSAQPAPANDDEEPLPWRRKRYAPRAEAPEPAAKTAKAKTSSSASYDIVVIPDTHVPAHNRLAWSVLLGVVRELRPARGIILGDFGELAAVSRHPSNKPDLIRLADEYEAINYRLDELQDAAGSCEFDYLEGNHEDRVTRYCAEWGNVDGMLDVPSNLCITDAGNGYFRRKTLLRGMRWVPLEQQPLVLPGLAGFFHGVGYESSNFTDLIANRYSPSRCAGLPVFSGHMHTFRQSTGIIPGTASQCCGFLGDEAEATFNYKTAKQHKPTGWQTGFVILHVRDGALSWELVRIVNGRAVWSGGAVTARAA